VDEIVRLGWQFVEQIEQEELAMRISLEYHGIPWGYIRQRE
jgi:hypothetical protein